MVRRSNATADTPTGPPSRKSLEADPTTDDPRFETHLIDLADALHSSAIHLLRKARQSDPASGLSPARLSALSVLVFAGPQKLHQLATHEQVRPATMSKLVDGLEASGLVTRSPHLEDRRAVEITATAQGLATLRDARSRRLQRIAQELERLSEAQRNKLRKAAPLLSRLGGSG